MKKYRVFGEVTAYVSVEVYAENKEKALEEASNQLPMLIDYAGNGGAGKIIGVDGEDQSISADGEIEYDDCELIGEGNDDDF